MSEPQSGLIAAEPVRYIVGTDKPYVQHITEIIVWPSKFELSDNCPDDPEQAGWHNINE